MEVWIRVPASHSHTFLLSFRYLFSVGFSFGLSAFVLHHYFLSSRYHVFSGLVSFQSTILFRRTWPLRIRHAMLYRPVRSFSDWIWNEPTQRNGRAVPAR